MQAGEPLVLICRVCGAPNALASRYCEVCRSTLEGARTATQADVGRRYAEHRRVQKRRRLLTFAGLLALLASLLASGYLRARFDAEVTLAPPASNLSSNSAPGEWTTKGHDESNSRYAPELPEFTGQLKWKLTTEEPFFSSPVATGDTVFSSTGDRRILALNALTGQIRWSVQVSGPVNSTPAVAGDVLVVALRGGLILALDARTGETRWEYDAGSVFLSSSPQIVEGEVYIGGAGEVYALDVLSGEPRWKNGSGGLIDGTLAVQGRYVFAGSGTGIQVFDRRNGKHLTTMWSGLSSDPVISGDTIIIADQGAVSVLDLTWRRPWYHRGPIRRLWPYLHLSDLAPPPPSPLIWSKSYGGGRAQGIAVTGDSIYFGTFSGNLLAVDRTTHEARWTYEGSSTISSSTVVAGKTAYAGAFDGTLLALDTETGHVRWTFKADGPIVGTPAVTASGIFFTSKDGALYALE